MKKELLKAGAIVSAAVLSITLMTNVINVSAMGLDTDTVTTDQVCYENGLGFDGEGRLLDNEDCLIEDNISLYNNDTYTEYANEYLALQQQLSDNNSDMTFEQKKETQENMSMLRAQLGFLGSKLDENGSLTDEDLAELDTIQGNLADKMAQRGYNKVKTNNGNTKVKTNNGNTKVKTNNGNTKVKTNNGSKGRGTVITDDVEQEETQTVTVF